MDKSKLWKTNGSTPANQNIINTRKIAGGLGVQIKNRKAFMQGKLFKVLLGLIGFVAALALALYIIAVRPAQAVLGKVKILGSDTQVLQAAFIDRDLITVEKTLGTIATDLEEIKKSRNANLAWMEKLSFTRPYYQDTERFLAAGFYGVDAVKEAVQLMKPFADAAGLRISEEQVIDNTSLMDAIPNWIAAMPGVAEGLDKVVVPLTSAGDELSHVDPSRYPETFRGKEVRSTIEYIKNILSDLSSSTPDIKEALLVIPSLLGVDSAEKRYMLIMQNDKEIRPTGGFWTSYATFRMKDAMLVNYDVESKDMYSIDDALDAIDYYYDFPDAPPAYAKYLKVEHWYARDTNSSPDFPTSIDQFMSFYNLASQVNPYEIKPVFAVISIDTRVVSEMIGVTGDVTVNGVTYTPDNVVLELERIASLSMAEQVGRKRVLGSLMKAMLQNVLESDKNLWPKLIDKTIDLANRKHIQTYFFDEKAQALAEKYKIGGRIIDPVVGDYAYVVSTNLGGDKTNWFVDKTVKHTLANEGGKWLRTVEITYNYPQPSEEYGPFIKRFRDWVRLYVPDGSTLVSVEGSSDTFGSAVERGKVYFDGFVEIGPTETATMTFKYYLPDTAVKEGVYDLYLQKQPGIEREKHVVVAGGTSQEIDLVKDQKVSIKL
ncbi:MAG: DUF4012 domain-containing protein [Patescibacteria group bacterium]|jgi:hypothetical protein